MGSPRERAVTAAAVALLAGAAALGYWALLGRAPAVPEPVLAVAEAPPEVRVIRSAGSTRLVRAGQAPVPLVEGAALQAEDVIESDEGGEVVLGAGESFQVLVQGTTRFAVKELTHELSRFRLEEGILSAKVRDDPARTVEVEHRSGAQLRTRGGAMTMAASGATVTGGVTEGTAEFESGGRLVVLGAGQGSSATAGGPPSPPARLPRSLLLKVEWPEGKPTNRRRIVVRGQTTPGAVLTLGGRTVVVGKDGRFSHEVVLREGAQRLEAVARDVAGRTQRNDGPTVVLDTRAPDATFDTRSLWKGVESRDKDRK
jgi:hypothetical protein